MNWLGYALLSAFAAGATAVLAKVGVRDVPSNLATAIRTTVVLLLAWGLVFVRGESRGLPAVSARTYIFLVLSALATGVSWLAYFKALQLAPASRVAPIDKLSLPIAVILAFLALGESVSPLAWLGVALMVIGALLTVAS